MLRFVSTRLEPSHGVGQVQALQDDQDECRLGGFFANVLPLCGGAHAVADAEGAGEGLLRTLAQELVNQHSVSEDEPGEDCPHEPNPCQAEGGEAPLGGLQLRRRGERGFAPRLLAPRLLAFLRLLAQASIAIAVVPHGLRGIVINSGRNRVSFVQRFHHLSLCRLSLLRLLRLNRPGRLAARDPRHRCMIQVLNRLRLGRVDGAAVPADEARRLLTARVVPAAMRLEAAYDLDHAAVEEPAFRRFAIVCDLEARLQEQRDRDGDRERDERHDDGVARVVVIWELNAGVVLQAAREVRRHGRVRKDGGQVAAVALHTAARAHGGAAQQRLYLGTTVHSLCVAHESAKVRQSKSHIRTHARTHALWHNTSRC